MFLPLMWNIVAGIVAHQVNVDTDTDSLIMYALSDLMNRPVGTKPTQDGPSDYLESKKGIYNHLKHHPVLMQRRLHVGSYPPRLPFVAQKRNSQLQPGLAQPVCPYTTDWQLIYEAKDMNESDVEVFQPTGSDTSGRQWFYTVTCDTETLRRENPSCSNCCRGINTRRYASQCFPKKSYVMALVRRSPNSAYDWNWIQVNTSCSCAVSPIADT